MDLNNFATYFILQVLFGGIASVALFFKVDHGLIWYDVHLVYYLNFWGLLNSKFIKI